MQAPNSLEVCPDWIGVALRLFPSAEGCGVHTRKRADATHGHTQLPRPFLDVLDDGFLIHSRGVIAFMQTCNSKYALSIAGVQFEVALAFMLTTAP